MKLRLQSDNGVTLIENNFIDRYMAEANGEYVKLYLYLLRCAGAGRELSVSSIADFFDHTEKDVRRALLYWERLNLLKLKYDSEGGISDILFLDSDRGTEGKSVQAAPETDPEVLQENPDAPPRKALSPARKRELNEQSSIRQLIFVGGQYLGRLLTTTEINVLLYCYDSLHFSEDLIEYLMEYCASKGNPGVRYMEKVAREWYCEGITSVEEAKKSSAGHNRKYYLVMQAMGIGDRSPASAEKSFIDKWFDEYGFSEELIIEACSRTVLATHQPSFGYADSILKKWKSENVRSSEDLRVLDAKHAAQRPAKQSPAAQKSSKFTQFPQRDYDYSQLEAQILRAQKQ